MTVDPQPVPKPLAVRETAIPGLLVLDLPVHADNRGWFKENWQRQKMVALGLPDFAPVQNNVSFNAARGATRGLHAEPWDKFVSVATGRIFGVWTDLRAGRSFGTVVTLEMGPDTAVFVPAGVANGFQTLTDDVAYSYLVNDHWSAAARDSYVFVNLADPTLAVDWPIDLTEAELSEADRNHPALADVVPFASPRTTPQPGVLVLGGNGQLGQALRAQFPEGRFLTRDEADLTDPMAIAALDLTGVEVVINAAAWTAVDAAETDEGRRGAWAVNVSAVAELARVCTELDLILVHVSSDYVFDGTRELHTEDEPFSPLGVYGQTKAAGDAAVGIVPRHYVVRTSWVVGQGNNFVRTMASLAQRGISPRVIDDQFGRLTFTEDLAAGIAHLVTSGAGPGTYNLTNEGEVTSWAQIARTVFTACGRSADDVTAVSTEEYLAGQTGVAPRPRHSALDLTRIRATGFIPRDGTAALLAHLAGLRP